MTWYSLHSKGSLGCSTEEGEKGPGWGRWWRQSSKSRTADSPEHSLPLPSPPLGRAPVPLAGEGGRGESRPAVSTQQRGYPNPWTSSGEAEPVVISPHISMSRGVQPLSWLPPRHRKPRGRNKFMITQHDYNPLCPRGGGGAFWWHFDPEHRMDKPHKIWEWNINPVCFRHPEWSVKSKGRKGEFLL